MSLDWYIFILITIFVFSITHGWYDDEVRKEEKRKRMLQNLINKIDPHVTTVLEQFQNQVMEQDRLVLYKHVQTTTDDDTKSIETQLNELREKIGKVGRLEGRRFFFCDNIFSENFTESRNAHYSKYFNDLCEKSYKRLLIDGVEKVKTKIIMHQQYFLYNLCISVDNQYVKLKCQEAELRYQLMLKKTEEEERRKDELEAQREFNQMKKQAEKDEAKAQAALDKQRRALAEAKTQEQIDKLNQRISLLEEDLKRAAENKERAISMAQQTRFGHVYIISNKDSFGEDIYKIGMTRRLVPEERIYELNNASVPFSFTIHRIVESEDAPKLENDLHQAFADKRVNTINPRKEFFKVSLEEIEQKLVEMGYQLNESSDVTLKEFDDNEI